MSVNDCDNPNGPCACGAWHKPPKRHRSEYPQSMQDVGDVLQLWDESGHLIDPPPPVAGMPAEPLLAAVILKMTKPGG